MCGHECVAAMYSLVHRPPQTAERASTGVVAVKDAHIAALHTQLRGKDRMLQGRGKVRTALYKVLYAVHGLIGNVVVNSIKILLLSMFLHRCHNYPVS